MEQDASLIVRDKRRYTRIDSVLDVHIRLSNDSTGRIYNGTTCNISTGGLCLQIERDVGDLLMALAVETLPLKLFIDLTEQYEIVEVDAETKWSSGVLEWIQTPKRKREAIQAGVAFVKLSDSVKNKISRYLESRQAGSSKALHGPSAS